MRRETKNLMNGPSLSSSSSRGVSRSKLYERYDVNIKTPSSRDSRSITSRCSDTIRRWSGDNDNDYREARQQLPIEEWTNVEMIRFLYQNSSVKSKLMTLLGIAILSSAIVSSIRNYDANNNSVTEQTITKSKLGERNGIFMDPDSHKRSNPFAPEGHQSYMEGVLEVKRVGGRKYENLADHNNREQPSPTQQQQQQDNNNNPRKRQQNNILSGENHMNSSKTFDELNRTHHRQGRGRNKIQV
mmetsp:Transcript_27226/g.56732  ORF Transcript_27226/g.56732 Transcript_27226/m.56732 type:complete len:243 (-) Transcript_27226:375-1103(-)